MGRTYAGILGPLACGMLLARGLVAGAEASETMLAASAGLFLFAAIGYITGLVADQLIRDSVRTQFQAALTVWEQERKTQPKPNT